MIDKIITFYCIIDDFLKSFNYYEDKQILMSDAEMLTVAVTSALFLVVISLKLYLSLEILNFFRICFLKADLINRRFHRLRLLFEILLSQMGKYLRGLI
jgi:hypothetical protein